jgi:hypothetical protein
MATLEIAINAVLLDPTLPIKQAPFSGVFEMIQRYR